MSADPRAPGTRRRRAWRKPLLAVAVVFAVACIAAAIGLGILVWQVASRDTCDNVVQARWAQRTRGASGLEQIDHACGVAKNRACQRRLVAFCRGGKTPMDKFLFEADDPQFCRAVLAMPSDYALAGSFYIDGYVSDVSLFCHESAVQTQCMKQLGAIEEFHTVEVCGHG